MDAEDGAVVGQGGHAVDEPDCEGGAEGALVGVHGAELRAGEDAGVRGATHAEFLLVEGVGGVALDGGRRGVMGFSH